MEKFARSKKEDTFNSVSDVTDPRLEVTIAEKIRMREKKKRINIYKSVSNMQEIPETTLCINICADIRVQLFHIISPL